MNVARCALVGLLAWLAFAPMAQATDASLKRARWALWQWDLESAERHLSEGSQSASADLRKVLKAQLLLQRSDYEAVDALLTPMVAAAPRAYEARVVLGKALYALGASTRAFTTLDALATEYGEGRLTSPRELMWLAEALAMTDYLKNANEIYQEAVSADPKLLDAKVRWAELFTEKYNYRDGDELLTEVQKTRKEDLRAAVGRARIDIASDHDYAKARRRLEAVVKASPQHVPAHTLLARIDLENELTKEAISRLTKVCLNVAPRDPEALALLGAAHAIRDDMPAFHRVEKRALALNPGFASFYTTISEHLSRVHRYKEAAALDRKALALNPRHWKAYVNLGIGLSRLGDDEGAQRVLNQAFDGDPFDVRTFNLLDQFYDGPIREYDWLEVAPMRVRVHREERSVLGRYVPPLLKEAYAHLSSKYGLSPELPIHVEIYRDPQLFAVKSVGLPGLAAHGICFGHVITSRSPNTGDFNWAEVLWHELSHVFHIQLSKSRVPRWFTEGLAVYEATEGRPEWQREMDETLLAYRKAERLRGVADFNLAFTRARSMQDMLVAYYHAYRMAEFIATTYGTPRMKQMLVLWGEKRTTAEVFKRGLGVRALEAFDASFFAWLDEKLAPLSKAFRLDATLVASEAPKRGTQADAHPTREADQVAAAVAWLGQGDLAKSLGYAERALALNATAPRALMVRATVRLEKGDGAGAATDLKAILSQGFDGPELQRLMARATRVTGDVPGAITHLKRSLAQDPTQGSLYHALISLLKGEGREKEVYEWRGRAVAIDQGNVGLVTGLLSEAERFGASKEDVLKWGELGNHIAPFSAAHHALFARELSRLKEAKRARYEAESALLIDPEHAAAKAVLEGLPPSP
ncbi:MAG: tetratricopeptide repeat protein [Myxococcota bacterium]